ncbi:carbohydrate kinase family protein [Flavicella sediminum]|uniref:carbohydrate kinase family protein n=1 Tax=Flavicella sediminum TaxID=2585141 RepID=UPI0011222B10|nr:carbohydrate kinase [Flavicella sediminum]
MKNIICFGEVLWDVFPEHKKIGGAPLNVAIRLQSLGNKVAIISRVGNDEDGNEIIDFIQQNKVNSMLVQEDAVLETGKVKVTLDPTGSASYDIKFPTAWDNIQLTDKAKTALQTTDAFVFGSLASRDITSRNTLYELLKLAPYKIFDVNLRKPHYSADVLNHLMCEADFIKFNDEELLEIAQNYEVNIETLEECVQFIAQKTNTKSICVTKGSKGAMLYFNNEFYNNPGYKIKVVDTVGAGDSFLASLIDQLLKDTHPQRALDFACAVGALVASREGANPKLKEQTIENLINS